MNTDIQNPHGNGINLTYGLTLEQYRQAMADAKHPLTDPPHHRRDRKQIPT
jgi:hypothetical protein